MKKYLPILLLLTMILSGCRLETQELPPPTELFAAIQAKVELPKMVDTAETDLEALIGIESDTYDSAVCYRLYEGTPPDEIIIVHARDNEMSREIQLLLEKRLGYKRESGELYLTEYQPMLRDGVVRLDGLTVSLIVSERVDEIVQIYNALQ